MKRIIILFIFILTFNLLYAQDNINITEYNLSNGFTVILKQIPKVPIVTAQIWVKCGSITEAEFGGTGISHFIEHLLFTTTKKHSTVEIAKKVKQLGCDMNGYTSFEQTVYHFTLPSENINKILPIIKEMIFEPAFKKSEIKKERNVILKEINMNIDDPDRFFSNLIFKSVYEKAYYKFPIIGIKDAFKKVKRSDIVKYYNRMYIPNNIAIIIVGKFDVSQIKEKLEKIFGSIPIKPIYPISLIEEPAQVGYKEVKEYRDDIILSRIAFAFKTVDIRHPDLFPLDVLALILGKGKSSVLTEILKEKKQLVKSISAFSYTPIGRGLFTIDAEVYNYNDIEKIKKEVFNILKNIKNFVKPKDVEKAKRIVLSNYYRSIETVEGCARELGINWISTGNVYFSKYYVKNIKKVTLADIEKVIKKYFTKDNLTFISLANTKYRKVRKSIQRRKTSFKKLVLNNGMKIVLNKDSTIPMVTIRIVFKGGVLFEPEDKYGLTYFLSKMLLRGTKNYSREAIIKTIEEKGGMIDTFVGNNSFGITINILKNDIKSGLKILSDIVINSVFPKKEIEKVREIILNEIKQQAEEIFLIGKKVMFKSIYNDYPYGELKTGTLQSIKNIKREDIILHYKFLCTPKNSVLSISGDFNDNIKEIIKRNFKNYKKRLKKEIIEPIYKIPKTIRSREIVTNINKEQTLLLISFYGIDVRNKDREKAELLWNILNGQGSRLFTAVREKKALAYYVGMFPFYGLTTGLFVFYVGTVADKVNIAKKEILKEIRKMVKNGITEKELNSAKKEAKAEKLREFQSNASISLNFALDELYGTGIRTIEEYNKIINSISIQEMNVFIKKYFNTNNYHIIMVKGK